MAKSPISVIYNVIITQGQKNVNVYLTAGQGGCVQTPIKTNLRTSVLPGWTNGKSIGVAEKNPIFMEFSVDFFE